MSKTTELFTIEQLAEELGAEVKAVNDSPTLTRSAVLINPNWRLFAEIEYNHMDRVKVSVSGGHTHFKRYIRPQQAEGSLLECSVGRGRDVTKAAAEVWRKLGVSAELTGQTFREAQAQDTAYRAVVDQIYDLLRAAPWDEGPSWTGQKHSVDLDLRRRHNGFYLQFDVRTDFDYCEGGTVLLTVPRLVPLLTLIEDQGWRISDLQTHHSDHGGTVGVRLNEGDEVEMVKALLDCWVSYQTPVSA